MLHTGTIFKKSELNITYHNEILWSLMLCCIVPTQTLCRQPNFVFVIINLQCKNKIITIKKHNFTNLNFKSV